MPTAAHRPLPAVPQVYIAPYQWSWPLNLPPQFFGIFPAGALAVQVTPSQPSLRASERRGEGGRTCDAPSLGRPAGASSSGEGVARAAPRHGRARHAWRLHGALQGSSGATTRTCRGPGRLSRSSSCPPPSVSPAPARSPLPPRLLCLIPPALAAPTAGSARRHAALERPEAARIRCEEGNCWWGAGERDAPAPRFPSRRRGGLCSLLRGGLPAQAHRHAARHRRARLRQRKGS